MPTPPPARIYISGHVYKIASPQAILPPLVNTVKLILNWLGPGGRIARNILFALKGTGSASTSDPTVLNGLANQVMSSFTTSLIPAQLSNLWQLTSVLARDNGGTAANSLSTSSSITMGNVGACQPPQVAICVSWQIAEVYRGGKPRTYLPGVPATSITPTGSSQISAAAANAMDAAATLLLNDFNSHPVSSTNWSLGTVSYRTGHSVRPTPLWRSYIGVRIHERVDSQRRRSGAEALFPVTT